MMREVIEDVLGLVSIVVICLAVLGAADWFASF